MTRYALVRSVSVVLLTANEYARSEAPKPSGGTSGPAAPAEVVASIDGKPILGRELDEKVDRRLSRLRQEEYEIRSQALEEMIGERLLETEARTRGITTEGLLHDEVDQQVKHLRLDSDEPAPAPQLPPLAIQDEVFEHKGQCLPPVEVLNIALYVFAMNGAALGTQPTPDAASLNNIKVNMGHEGP